MDGAGHERVSVSRPRSMPILQLLSQIGVMLFMFVVGLELDSAHLRGRRAAAVAVSHVSIIVPFVARAWRCRSRSTRSYAPAGRAVPCVRAVLGDCDEHHGVSRCSRASSTSGGCSDAARRDRDHVRGGRRRHGVVHPGLRRRDRAAGGAVETLLAIVALVGDCSCS